MASPIVHIQQLRRTFGSQVALDDVSLSVPEGGVFGLVGANGAGKTTLIRHILGLYRAQAGCVHVFGRDPVRDPVGVLARIGYLSEDRDLPLWMKVSELLAYTRAFYPDWDSQFAHDLMQMFELPPAQRVKLLSRGQLARLGLLLALAHRPELLLLDEPSSGLDPVVRQDILAAVIRTVAEEGRTVLFSSHLLEEVERVADRVAMLHQGRLILNDGLEQIKSRHRVLTVRFRQALAQAPELGQKLTLRGGADEWACLCLDDPHAVRARVAAYGGEVVAETVPTLDEIFLAHARSAVSA